ncbi:MAG TPA: hypothetical protein VIX60_05065 [Candidatus Cybelea sp.]
MNKSIGALALFATASMLAACNGNNNGVVGPGPTSTPSGNCGRPPNQMEVLYPIPHSHGAPPGLPTIYVATKGALPPSNSYDFYLSQSSGAATFTGPFAQVSAAQIPTPHAKPSYSNPTYYATAIAGPYGSTYIIGPQQAVSLLWNDGGRNCSPFFVVASFHTK